MGMLFLAACKSSQPPPPAAPLPDPTAFAPLERNRPAVPVTLPPPTALPPLGAGRPLAFLHEARQTEGGLEIGPPLKIAAGPFRGDGMVADEDGIDALFRRLDALPLVDQARLQANRFAATQLELDIDDDNVPESIFLTIEFPPSGEIVRERTDPLTGELERRIFRDGKGTETITERRITECTVDDEQLELSTRTYNNEGTIDDPRPGALIEETRTLEAWFRDWSAEDADPALPVISKIRVNYITGASVKETYGLYPRPIESVDGRFVTEFQLGSSGLVEGSQVFANGVQEQDFARPLLERLQEPVRGELRFRYTALPGSSLASLREGGYRLEMEREDVLRGLSRRIVLDLSNHGRTLSEHYEEDLPGAGVLPVETRFHYSDDHHFGFIPQRAETRCGAELETVLSQVETVSFDPLTRRLAGLETLHTGKVQTVVWDARWESPVEIASNLRKTIVTHDRRGLSFTSKTTTASGDETIANSRGAYDRAGKQWTVQRTLNYREGTPLRQEQLIRTPTGRLVSSLGPGGIVTRTTYAPSGVESMHRSSFTRDGTEVLTREEGDFTWESGARRAHVTTFIEGEAYDRFQILTDPEGRTVEDGIKEFSGLQLKTIHEFAGATERLVRSEFFQNGRVRITFEPGEVTREPDGTNLLPVTFTPHWGPERVDYFQLNGSSPTPVRSMLTGGEEARVQKVFPGLATARTTLLVDAAGEPREETVLAPAPETTNSIPVDLQQRFKLGAEGSRRLLEERALVRGTNITLYTENDGKRIYHDITKLQDAPRFEVDLSGTTGVSLAIEGENRSQVTRIFRSTPDRWQGEPALRIESIDLREFFSLLCYRRIYDRAGRLVIQEVLRPRDQGPAEEAYSLLDRANDAVLERKSVYHFAEGPAGSNRSDLTRIEVTERAEGSDKPSFRAAQSLVEPRDLGTNPYLPDAGGPWRAWKLRHGSPVEDRLVTTVIYDGRDQPAVSVSPKRNSRGEEAERVAYDLRQPDAWVTAALEEGLNRIKLPLPAAADFSNCHFLAFTLRGPTDPTAVSLALRDRQGREAIVGADGGLAFWPADGETVQWLPQPIKARAAASVRARHPGSFVVSVPELRVAGLDITSIDSAELLIESPVAETLERTDLQRLATTASLPPSSQGLSPGSLTLIHSNGLSAQHVAPVAKRGAPSLRDTLGNKPFWNSDIRFQGLTVAKVRPRIEAASYPVVILQDPGTLHPTPLYALVAESGEFLEYYHRVQGRDTHVYTIASGFRPPRVETFREGFIEDEASPGILALGDEYRIELPLSRTSEVHNRVASSIFKLGADRIDHLLEGVQASDRYQHPDPAPRHRASLQASTINELPTLAEALLPFRDVPWRKDAAHDAAEQLDWSDELFDSPNVPADWFPAPGVAQATPLTPTSPGSKIEPFVDTEEEARLIQTAVHTGQFAAAARALDFYWDKSRGGTEALHTSYDLRTGASLHLEPQYRRPSESPRSSRANLAIAEAALDFGETTGDRQAFRLAQNLLALLLDQYRAPSGGAVRAVSRFPHRAAEQLLGLPHWPDPARFDLDTNARLLLALRRASPPGENITASWDRRAAEAIAELESWLRTMILPQVERTGVVPNGLFEIQDVQGGTSALAVSRWTSAGAWMSFLEAASAIGASPDAVREWLEGLARVHGTLVDGCWGLDWSVPLSRPESISPELTARFFRLAKLLEHREAAIFAREQLDRLGAASGEPLPKVVTTAPRGERLPTGQNRSIYPLSSNQGWPRSLAPYRHLTARAALDSPGTVRIDAAPPAPHRDVRAFVKGSAWFYLSILLVAIVWWGIRHFRKRRSQADPAADRLVSDTVMAMAEKRWAERVVGVTILEKCPNSRFANGPVEGNFVMQLRALYKLVLEWRRRELGRDQGDLELSDLEDPWLNGADEFASMVAIYMRSVIKAGLKDGFHEDDPLQDPEDSNHIWSRLVLYFSEYYSGMLALLQIYDEAETARDLREVNQQIFLLLNAAGMRQRKTAFDSRQLFDIPGNPEAFDLLIVQRPGITLEEIVASMEEKLGIPARHFRAFVKRYKEFKQREKPYPIHPFVLEAAKVFPHFLLVGLLGVLWYNSEISGLPVLPYLTEAIGQLAAPRSLSWALPLLAGYGLGVVAYYLKFLRFEAGMRRTRPMEKVFLPVQNLIRAPHYILPLIKQGRRWDPTWYERSGYLLRGIAFFLVALELIRLPTPSFAVFMILKGVFALLLLIEAAAIFLPIAATWLSMWLQMRVEKGRRPWRLTIYLNQLNIPATRPASVVWQAIVYHYEISVPSGSLSAFLRAILLYFFYAALFLFAGSYVFKEVLAVWFADTYQLGRDFRLFIGGLIFFNTMYLLRFGLFVLLSSIAAALATYPLRAATGLATIGVGITMLANREFSAGVTAHPGLTWSLASLGFALILFEEPVLRGLRRLAQPLNEKRRGQRDRAVEAYRRDESRTLGIVYMSGDELGFRKLTPDVLMDRVEVLRDRLGSPGLKGLAKLQEEPDDESLRDSFAALHDLESRHDTTVWHPAQLVTQGEEPAIPDALELNLSIPDAAERDRLLGAWHLRRWLVSMMSSAGHSQDTAINLVDIALRIAHERLSQRTVFYLIQNKYDARDDNRPSEMRYDAGELGQREKLTRLLCWASPGSRAFSLNDWTPFGFKAGGMMGMDLVPEETLNLTNMVVLDRNATVHDLDALTEDIFTAISDPGVVNVIPGRGTTNTLTPIGQGSQAMEEGHRELIKGVMLMGGEAGESVGTGWGNIQAIYYGRTQRAMMDQETRRLPLTTRMMRGSTFVDRLEGMVGFGPHAVGISEDIWAVIQATHNAVSLGLRVKFKRSTAMWHKIRETWSHADWFSAFPRWSGGFLQMMQDPLMQRISDKGPLSVFAKEMRANNGRFFLCAPFALLSILAMPLAIIADASPFVQILIVLWNVGFVMNQVLTSLGLVATLEATGFSRVAGLIGAGVAGGLAIAGEALSLSGCALVTLLGLLGGGFLAGLGRWLYNRGRDIILFGPQLVIFSLGQLVRQSLEFVLSGATADDAKGVNIAFRASAGPREDRPVATYTNLVNLRSVVWVIGGISLALSLFALTTLDFLNVVLLLPSLLFGVSCLAGPFLLRPKAGSRIGPAIAIPKTCGWATGFILFVAIAGMVTRGGHLELIAYGLSLLVLGWLASRSLRYIRFPAKVRRARRTLARILERESGSDLDSDGASAVAARLLASAGDRSATDRILAPLNLSQAGSERISAFLEHKAAPMLRAPSDRSQRKPTAVARLACEYRRSFALSVLTLVWFLIVPVPALLLFTTGDYRFAVSLDLFVSVIAGGIGVVLAAALLGLLVERICHLGAGKWGLRSRIQAAYRRFRSQPCSDYQTSSIFALFTDLQTYLDQRAYGYAQRTLEMIENRLDGDPADRPGPDATRP